MPSDLLLDSPILVLDPREGESRADYLTRAVETARRQHVKLYVEWSERVTIVTPTSTVLEVSRRLGPTTFENVSR